MGRLSICGAIVLFAACAPFGTADLPSAPSSGDVDRDTTPPAEGDVDVDPRAIDWFVEVGEGASRTVVVSNPAGPAFTVNDVQIDGDDVFEADVRGGVPVELGAGDDLVIEVDLRADDAGDYEADLLVETSVGTESVSLEAVIGA